MFTTLPIESGDWIDFLSFHNPLTWIAFVVWAGAILWLAWAADRDVREQEKLDRAYQRLIIRRRNIEQGKHNRNA